MREAVVDANVLLRYLTDQPRDLADRAVALLETAEAQGLALVVPPLILAEVVYVVESVYHWDWREVADRLEALVASSTLTVLEGQVIVQALAWYRQFDGLDFADSYVAAVSGARADSAVISFDHRLRRIPGIRLVQSPDALRPSEG